MLSLLCFTMFLLRFIYFIMFDCGFIYFIMFLWIQYIGNRSFLDVETCSLLMVICAVALANWIHKQKCLHESHLSSCQHMSGSYLFNCWASGLLLSHNITLSWMNVYKHVLWNKCVYMYVRTASVLLCVHVSVFGRCLSHCHNVFTMLA